MLKSLKLCMYFVIKLYDYIFNLISQCFFVCAAILALQTSFKITLQSSLLCNKHFLALCTKMRGILCFFLLLNFICYKNWLKRLSVYMNLMIGWLLLSRSFTILNICKCKIYYYSVEFLDLSTLTLASEWFLLYPLNYLSHYIVSVPSVTTEQEH